MINDLYKFSKLLFIVNISRCKKNNLNCSDHRYKLLPYFEKFIPQYGAYHQNLRNNHIRLPAIRCEFGKNNSKYQMHFRLRELASPSNPPLYPNIDISDDILSQSLSCFAKYVISKYISSYYVTCNVKDCYTCDNS